MNKRLRFAAARKARIEARYPRDEVPQWQIAQTIPLNDYDSEVDWEYRIHPDDEHLQYGPISTVLRERVIQGDPWFEGFALAMNYVRYRWASYGFSYSSSLVDDLTTLLILAEFLADEGL